VLLWSLVAGTLWWNHPVLVGALLVLFGAAATREYLAMLQADGLLRKSLAHGALVIGTGHLLAVMLISLQGESPAGFWVDSITLCGAAILGLSVMVLAFSLEEKTLREITAALLGIIYVPILFAFAIRIYFLGGQSGIAAGGVPLLLLLIAVTKTNDMSAYLVGTAIGKHKMIPRVSPGKTWEGFIGSLIITILMAVGIIHLAGEHLAPMTVFDGVVLGLLLALFSVLGGLPASALQRCLRAKDSGHSLPGIGGILDLIDSLLFTGPVLYLYLMLVS